jgi:hypothetical protein
LTNLVSEVDWFGRIIKSDVIFLKSWNNALNRRMCDQVAIKRIFFGEDHFVKTGSITPQVIWAIVVDKVTAEARVAE